MKVAEKFGYRTASVNGAELAYAEEGSGDPVVFVHGGISDLTIWKYQVPAFAESYRAIAYSRRHHWPNKEIADGADYEMGTHADDLADLIKQLKLAPVHLVGNSWGAFMCLITALRYPELVRTLTLEEPPVLPLFVGSPPAPGRLIKLFVSEPSTGAMLVRLFVTGIGPAVKAFKRGDLEGGVRAFALGVPFGKENFERLPAEVKEQMLKNAKTLKAELLGSGFPPFSEADARNIKIPTLLISGQRSPKWLYRLTDRLEELLPNVERVIIPGASHLMHYENPEETNQAIRQFLSRHS